MNEMVDLRAVTRIQQQVWSRGDFAAIGLKGQIVAENLVEAVDVMPGERVLDVACGAGNVAIAAARHFADVVGLDYVPALLERARVRSAAEGLEIDYVEGDAQDLPFEDGSFDAVVSTFGAMFAPDQPKTASELLRVCRSGGRVGMCNWTPEGIIGRMFQTVSKHAPLPPGVQPPILWGTEDHVRALFGDAIVALAATRRNLTFRYRSPEQWLEYFRQWFGPVQAAFERVGPEEEEALARDLIELWRGENRAGDAALVADAEYLQVVATRA